MKNVAPSVADGHGELILPQAADIARLRRIPAELRQRAQWVVAGADKVPRRATGGPASVADAATWADFDTACRAAIAIGALPGFVLTAADPLCCIDLDVKPGMTTKQLQRQDSIVSTLDSYTELSLSGVGRHIWVEGDIGVGCKRDGIEVYSQGRFIICTGDVARDRPIMDRQAIVLNMVSRMRPATTAAVALRADSPDDEQDWYIAQTAFDDGGKMGDLYRTQWQKSEQYESHSNADMALMLMLARLTESNGACRGAFRLSALGKRAKATKDDRYLNLTLGKVRPIVAEEAFYADEGRQIAQGLFWPKPLEVVAPNPLDLLRVDWTSEADVEVPDIIPGFVADEDVTLLGGHGGIGKSFLALQMGCAVAVGESVLLRQTRKCRVLYYSAEDGRKRLIRRLRRLIEVAGLDEAELRQNLMVLDASEIEPLYGETIEQCEGKQSAFMKVLGPRSDFANLQTAVGSFDPQLVIIDGASDTFDGNEIARREVRAFIKLLRRVHPHRKVGVLLSVHIDRSSARGHATDDDGYAGSAQWHNSCRRRLFLQQKSGRERDDEGRVPGDISLRVMKNQDGPTDPDIIVTRGLHGLWQIGGVDISRLTADENEPNQAATLLSLVESYYGRGRYISTSLAPNASTGIYATLKDDPGFPQGLTRKRTAMLVGQLERDGCIVVEQYKRGNRGIADRWAVVTQHRT